jgi:hypothetical protein
VAGRRWAVEESFQAGKAHAPAGQQPAQPGHRDHADGGVADRGPDRTNDRLQVGDQRGAITWTALEPKLAPMT